MERQRWAMHQLFGWELPDSVISLDAPRFANDFVSLVSKLGTLTHERCHSRQAHDADGNLRIVRSGPRKGQPVWSIVPLLRSPQECGVRAATRGAASSG